MTLLNRSVPTVVSCLQPLAVGITLTLTTCAVQADDQGFIDDAKVNLNLRNYYINRNFTDPTNAQSKADEWTQSFILDARSGFTQGVVGFGVDVLGTLALKLDSGGGTTGTGLLPQTGTGSTAKRGAPDSYGRVAVAGKSKLSKTELKIGEWMAVLPILRSDDARSLPQTFEGGQVTSKEIDGLTLYGGQMHQVRLRNSSNLEDMTFRGATSDRFNFVGGEYKFNDNQTQIGVWNAELKDIYQQQFVNLIHTQEMGPWELGANLGYFTGKGDGAERAGRLDNKTSFGLFSAKFQAHTFYVGLQKLTGQTQWMRVQGTSGGTVANDTWNNSFDNAQERSWQVRYDYNFAALGLLGLTSMVRYVHGDNVHDTTSGVDDGKEWVRDIELGYTLQSGPLKNLNVRLRNSDLHKNYGNTAFEETRVIISYPINLF